MSDILESESLLTLNENCMQTHSLIYSKVFPHNMFSYELFLKQVKIPIFNRCILKYKFCYLIRTL